MFNKIGGKTMEQKYTYYACMQFKDGYIEKKSFKDRNEARQYISENYDPEIHKSCWTE
jgi:hypothetical protein